MRKLFDIVRRILAIIVCITIVAALSIMLMCAPVLYNLGGQIIQNRIVELDEKLHP